MSHSPKTAASEPVTAGRDSRPSSAGADTGSVWDRFLDQTIAFFTSMRLTVVCLLFGMILVFAGTLAQVELGLYRAQNEFFRSFFVVWAPGGGSVKIPLPGGYLVGGILLINLVASHFKRFKFTRDKAGIWMVHAGLILLLLGQLGTDLLSRESTLHLREGEIKNYSEADRLMELAIIDKTDPARDKVIAIPQSTLSRQKEINHPDLPFTLRIKNYFPNSLVENREASDTAAATQGIGTRARLKELPAVTEMDKRDLPSAVVEVVTPQSSLGTWLASAYIDGPQPFACNNRSYEIVLRSLRYYKPFSLQLLDFRHDVYPGTQTPKNFSSRVLLQRADTGEKREVLIYMNNPLRYAGETFYQSSFDSDDKGSILQVVRNPSWLTPYFSCILVGLGLTVHFIMHLLGFSRKRKTPKPA